MQIVPGQRPGDQVGDQHGNGELPQQQPHDIPDARAEHLADADFLGAAAGGEGGQAEQAQAGDGNGDQHKDAEHRALAFVHLIELAEAVIQEAALDGADGREGPPGLVDEGQGLRDAVRAQPDRKLHGHFRDVNEDRRLDGLARAIDLGVRQDPHDPDMVVVEQDGLAHGVLRREAQTARPGFIDQDIATLIQGIAFHGEEAAELIIATRSGQSASGDQLYAIESWDSRDRCRWY